MYNYGRLDYCNSLLTGVGDSVLRKLQSVQNAAARLNTNTRKFDHIKPVLRDLLWLSVRLRIVFKTAMLVYKYLQCLAPSYLTEFCRPVSTPPGHDSCGLPPQASSMFQEHGRPLAAKVSQPEQFGTVYLLSCEHSISLLRRLPSV